MSVTLYVPRLEIRQKQIDHYRVKLGAEEYPVLVDIDQVDSISWLRFGIEDSEEVYLLMRTRFNPVEIRHGHPLIAGTIVGHLHGNKYDIDFEAMQTYSQHYARRYLTPQQQGLFLELTTE